MTRLALAWLVLVVSVAAEESTLFVVARPNLIPLPPSDSYVLPLADPTAIAKARALVASGGFMIVTAKIAAGADGINRDVQAQGMPPWSWHVVEFLGFSDTTIEVCDGSPTLLEQDVAGWIQATGGMVCFWAYTVVAEIAPRAVQSFTWSRIKAIYRSP